MRTRFTAVATVVALAGCTQTDSRADAPRLPPPGATDTAIVASGARGANAAPVSTTPAARAAANYLGLRYEALPRGFAYHAGSVVAPRPGDPAGDYAFSQVGTPKGEMIWLDSLGAAIRNGDRARTVRASLVIPPLSRDERLFMASCDVRGSLDPMVVAIVVNEADAGRYPKVRQAWRANAGAERFEVIPIAGVVCEDPGS